MNVPINKVPLKIELTLESLKLGERIANPQDLNDALLAVAYDNQAARLEAIVIQQMKDAYLAGALDAPSPPLHSGGEQAEDRT